MNTPREHRTPENSLILITTAMGVGMHLGAWRYRTGEASDYLDLEFYKHIARSAERGVLHGLFLADTLALSEENLERPNLGALDPIVVLSALASVTDRLGLVATSSTTFNEPFNLARRFSALDHLSGGRAGFNVVTTFVPDVAANFGASDLPQHDNRYARAEEAMDVITALWHSWGQDALIGDKTSGVFADREQVRPINHAGQHFSVRGPLTLPRTRQGRPVVFQAGASETGRQLAARTADAVFTVQNTRSAASEFRADLRRRAEGFGRHPDSVKVLPGLVPVIGRTREEARARKLALDELSADAELRKLALRVGVPVDALDLDKPLPVDLIRANPSFNASHGFRDAVVRLAVEENLTVREVLYRNGGGHAQVVGTPDDVADLIIDWYRNGAVDGFNLMIDVLPDGLDDFVDLVVPRLQDHGVFRTSYQGTTFRDDLGLSPVLQTVS
ncbi:putative FMNH2-dependent monooxygenase [Gordonia namibiensis NBRC 108229]|uniref:Putative FMNH2-dependent monooxygenase n=1 Tax=Gordonia namibiensis NBRC 108229 TaxID=1208314 RepID=K6XEE7_9ACTN|nr:LLM class flavin-dependent oxidoreductase [Gordonia namibiensis]GAC02748.1 putative FMNH2-dependent monooxygenase [Gordonia namibiensis NBRC 108229]